VISIIALLIALLLPSLTSAREAAKLAVCASNLRQNAMAILVYGEDYEEQIPYVPNSQGDPPHHWSWPYVSWQAANDGHRGPGLLVYGGYLSSPDSLYCVTQEPGTLYAREDYENWPLPPTGNTSRIGYDMIPDGNPRRQLELNEYEQGPLMNDCATVPDPVVATSHRDVWNAVYVDGHVSLLRNDDHTELRWTTAGLTMLEIIGSGSNDSWPDADRIYDRFTANY